MNRYLLRSMPVIASIMLFLSLPALGQNNPSQPDKEQPEVISIPVTNGRFASDFRNDKMPVSDVGTQLPTWLGLTDEYTFELQGQTHDNLGYTHAQYQEFFKGIEVFGGMALVHSRDGNITSINGQVAHVDPKAGISPVVSSAAANDIAQREVGVAEIMTAYAPSLTFIASEPTGVSALAWKLRIDGRTADRKVKMYEVFVDAVTGKVIRKASLIMDGDVSATAKTVYSGNQTITTDSYQGGYRLIDNDRNIETYNVSGMPPNLSDQSLPLFPAPDHYTNSSTTWGKIPTFMSITLQAASPSFTAGIGTTYILASVIGKINSGNPDLISLYPLYGFSGQGGLPVTTQNMYVPVSEPSYFGGYFKMHFQNNQVNVVDQLMFEASDLTVGTHPWVDEVAGNGSGTYTISLEHNPALDAHWGIEMTHDFYLQTFNRNSYDGAGSVLKNYINGMYAISGTQDNASAMPPPYTSMVYGLGDGEAMGPVVALDVAGHEFTHLVTGYTAGLVYQGESGALNESFSDIMGTCIEFFVKPDEANWLIGEDVVLNGSGSFRSMSNPNASNTPQPDTYNGMHWASTNPSSFDNGGVHINSGVGNFWFYLLTKGGTGTNDISNYYNVYGIGIEESQKIAYRTLVYYLTPSAQYMDAYNSSLEAATDLYGANSQEYQSVRQAWYAVGIGDSATAPPVAIEGPDAMQSEIRLYPNPNNGTFTVDNQSDGIVKAEVTSLTGTAVQAIRLLSGINKIDLTTLSKGIYFIRFSRNGMAAYTEKIIIR